MNARRADDGPVDQEVVMIVATAAAGSLGVLESNPERISNDRDSCTQIALVAHALAHPFRVETLVRLASNGPMVVADLVEDSGFAQSTVSEHLRVLRGAGLVVPERVGRWVWYGVGWAALGDFIGGLVDVSGVRFGLGSFGPAGDRQFAI
jgi:ArsR family transcriptional regulator